MTKSCKNCKRRIAWSILNNTWYHVATEAARCFDDASFDFAEPKS